MRERYYKLRSESWDMEDGKQKLAVLEEMILIADRHMTEQDAYSARMNYSSAVLECGCPERLFVSFAWCLKRFEQSPGDYSSHEIMWHYKWVLGQIWRLPQISTSRIELVFEDFKQKCLQYGFSLRPYYQKLLLYKQYQGDKPAAAEYFKLWRESKHDHLSDCKACEQNMFGKYYFELNHNKKGIQAVKPILEGKVSCSTVPQNTYSQVISPLLKLGEYEQAAAMAKKALRALKGPQYLWEYGIFMEFYTVTDLPKAVKLYERTIRLGLECRMPWDRLHYLLSVRLFLQEWGKTRRRKKLLETDQVTAEWLNAEIAALAAAFNERNGNEYVHELIAEKEQNMKRLLNVYRNQARGQ
jgi:hypothetical protein